MHRSLSQRGAPSCPHTTLGVPRSYRNAPAAFPGGAHPGCHTASRLRRCRRACLVAAAPVEQAQAQASSNGKSAAAAGPSGQQDPNAVLVTEERLPQSHIRLTVTVPPALVRKSYDKGLKQLRSKTEVPGFRAGKKVPHHVLVDAVGGEHMVNGTCVERMLKDVLPVALQPYRDAAVSESEHIEEEFDDLIAVLDLQAPFTFHIGLDVQGELSWKAPYHDIEVEVASVGSAETDTAEVEAKLQQLRKSKGTMKVVPGRALQQGDVAIVDFSVTRLDSNELIAGSERRGMQLDTGLGDRAIGLSGVVAGMEGMAVGEQRSINASIGDTWWEANAVRGVETRCDITLKELFEWELPEVGAFSLHRSVAKLTDDFVRTAMPGMQSVEALRAQLLRSTAAQREEEQKDRVAAALIAAVAERVRADVPESAIRQLAENEYQAHLHKIQLKEQMSFEQVNKLATQELLQRFTDIRREELTNITLANMGMEAIFQAEGLSLTEDEIKAEMSEAAEDFMAAGEEFDDGRLREQVVEVLKAQKVIGWLEQNVKVTVK